MRGGENMSRLKSFAAILLILVLMMPVNVIAEAKKSDIQFASKAYATWLWDTSQIIEKGDQIITFLLANNVKCLYLQIDYSLEFDVYKKFIEQASKRGIDIQALEGSPQWVSDDGINMEKLFFEWLTDYNNEASINQKFKGVHLDVEPYLNEQYSTNKKGIVETYQKLLLSARSKSKGLGLPLAVDIPFWFDDIRYDNQYGSGRLAEWVISHINNVAIMAYRDEAAGNNGIIKLVLNEMKWANKYGCAIIIGVETQPLAKEDEVTFYEEGQHYMNNELSKVYDRYKTSSSFKGFAMHHVTSWSTLKK